MINKTIKQLYNVDKLEIVYSTNNGNVFQISNDLNRVSNKKKINDNRFQDVFENDYYYVGLNNRYSNEDGEKVKIKFKCSALHTIDYMSNLKPLISKYNLKEKEVNIDICLDTDSNIYQTFDYIKNNTKKYKTNKTFWTSKYGDEAYKQIIIGSKKGFYFRLYNKSKELLKSKKEYISNQFINEFGPHYTIYRLELSLKPKHCKDIRLEVFRLQDKEYLKQVFKTYFTDRCYYKEIKPNDSNSARWEKKFLFDVNGDTCIRKSKVNKVKTNRKESHAKNGKTIVRNLYDFYQITQKQCVLDTIKEYCFFDVEVKAYANRIIKDVEVLNIINSIGDFDLF